MPAETSSSGLFNLKTQAEITDFALSLCGTSRIRYVPEEKRWRVYDTFWDLVDEGWPYRYFNTMILPAIRNLPHDGDDAWRRWEKEMGQYTYQTNILKLLGARHQTPLSGFDVAPHLLNFRNGTYDLKALAFREPSPDDRLTVQLSYNYEPSAACPRWEKFLARILPPDIIRYLQTFFGVCLSGEVLQMFLFFWGHGKNGKSVLTRTVAELLGGYVSHMPSESLISWKNGGMRATPEIAALRGKRLAFSTEVEEGRLNETLVKNLCSTDEVRGRFLYRDYVVFRPTHKLVISGNNEPVIRGTDLGIWRRVKKIPFVQEISDAERVELNALVASHLEESSGIANWMLDGWKRYRTEGIVDPESVVETNRLYRLDQDFLQQYIQERCDAGPGMEARSSLLLQDFNCWLAGMGVERKWDSRTFAQRLRHKGYSDVRRAAGTAWAGLALKPGGGFAA